LWVVWKVIQPTLSSLSPSPSFLSFFSSIYITQHSTKRKFWEWHQTILTFGKYHQSSHRSEIAIKRVLSFRKCH
jgi:hypothetical protein